MNERIKMLRNSLGMTQQSFADRLGIKRNTIANYEAGRNNPVDSVVSLICKEFDVSEEWLREGSGKMFVPRPEDELDALVLRYGLSPEERVLIQKFVELPAKDREVVINYIDSVASALNDPPRPKTIPEMTEEEIRQRAKKIEEEMLLEKKAAEQSSLSKRTVG